LRPRRKSPWGPQVAKSKGMAFRGLRGDVVEAVAHAEVQGEIGLQLPLVFRIRVDLGLTQSVDRKVRGISGGADLIRHEAGDRGERYGAGGRVSLVEFNAANLGAELEDMVAADDGQVIDPGEGVANAWLELVVRTAW